MRKGILDLGYRVAPVFRFEFPWVFDISLRGRDNAGKHVDLINSTIVARGPYAFFKDVGCDDLFAGHILGQSCGRWFQR